jgi:hypothetical protein
MRAAALVLTFGAIAGAARAGDADCLLQALPPPVRESLVAGPAREPGAENAKAALAACGVVKPNERTVELARFAISTRIEELAVRGELARDGGLTEDLLEAAWAKAPEADRQLLRQGAPTLDDQDLDVSREFLEAVERTARLAGWTGTGEFPELDPAYRRFMSWIITRAIRETAEAQF